MPGLRLAARRPAHAAHGDDPLGLGLLRLRPDLHLALLRRAADGRLRAVQLRDAGHRQAVRGHPRRGVQARRARRSTTPSSSSISACRPRPACRCDLLPQGDQRRADHRHRRAGLRRADPCRGQGRAGRRHAALCARRRPSRGPVQAPAQAARERAPDGHPDRRDVPGRSGRHRRAARAAGPRGWRRWCRRANGASSMPRSTARRPRRSIPSTRRSCASSRRPGRPVVGSGPVGVDGTAAWLEAIGEACGVPARRGSTPPRTASLPAIQAALAAKPDQGPRSPLSGYEGSELLVARLLIESGADVPYVGTACPRTAWTDPDREWLEAKGAHVQYRASLEQDLAAMQEFEPGPRDRHHAGGAEGQGAGHPGALLHQPDLGPAAVRRRRRRLAGRRSSTPRPPTGPRFDAHARVLRRRRQGRRRRLWLDRRADRPSGVRERTQSQGSRRRRDLADAEGV